ncbi:hypothetical protein BC826DRAFT_1034704 [Russula brevipes]|nr:hypothetical protein BC826DRAFT_1034704 [Russula brevipes]
MWITGFDKLMPESCRASWKLLPRPGARLSVTFGAPLSPAAVPETLAAWCDRNGPSRAGWSKWRRTRRCRRASPSRKLVQRP